jgi:putative FmdB family regulatory protein
MPTYDYKCEACGHRFEKFQSMSSAPIRKCPKCGKSKVKRLIGTGAGVIFKGSGFYITDYRDAGYKEKAKADSGAPAETKSGEPKPSAAPSEGSTGSTTKDSAPAKAESKPAAKSTKPHPKK